MMNPDELRQAITAFRVETDGDSVTNFIEAVRSIAREEAEAIRAREAGEELAEIKKEQDGE